MFEGQHHLKVPMGSRKTLLFLKFSCILLPSLLLSPQPNLISGSTVEILPGFDGPLPFVIETGYVGVDELEDVQLFYYFVPSQNNPKEDPLMLWLTGGPGCSAISGLLYEIGPIKFQEVEYNGSLPRLQINPYSWTKAVSVIFLDQPVGTGFSYARTAEASHSGDFKASHNANEFLRKWLIDHPEYRSNPVYLGGDSYTGLTLPLYFLEMSQGSEEGIEPFINLKGYVLGNPATDVAFEGNFRIPFAHGKGLISDELCESLDKSCKGNYTIQTEDPANQECNHNLLSYYKSIQGIQLAHVLEESCGFATPKPQSLSSPESTRRSVYDNDTQGFLNQWRSILLPSSLGAFGCRIDGYRLSSYWLNDESVQEAIHVQKGSIKSWVRCNYALNYTNDIRNTMMHHKKLSNGGYRSLIYSGDHDMFVTFLGTQAWVRSLNYSAVDDWRSWMVEGQVGGYTRTYSNQMTFATVKGGGHTAPEYRPEECHAMFTRWITERPL